MNYSSVESVAYSIVSLVAVPADTCDKTFPRRSGAVKQSVGIRHMIRDAADCWGSGWPVTFTYDGYPDNTRMPQEVADGLLSFQSYSRQIVVINPRPALTFRDGQLCMRIVSNNQIGIKLTLRT